MGETRTELFRELIKESKVKRQSSELVETVNNTEKIEVNETQGQPKEIIKPPKNNKSVKLAEMIFEYNPVKNSNREKPEAIEEDGEKEDDGSRVIKIFLNKRELEIFKSFHRTPKFKKYKKFGYKRRLFSLIDRISILETREKKSLDVFRIYLSNFKKISDKYRSEYRDPKLAPYTAEYLKEFTGLYKQIYMIFNCLGFTRDEIAFKLSLRENEALRLALLCAQKEKNGDFDPYLNS